ncbi:hypothetical protein VT50_0225150 [Streptomyces antioxidans]|uniref:Uncharacterized protein n=1 Tax=Streptomyces antioxidans TaxID=1507734 RepID=A0A1V4CZR3_9ACTN|nr:hypothetical protein VT50_0225150 [Streptomyces antioxidans]
MQFAGFGALIPACALRALTMPGCPRMLQVALRACAPRTEQAALASVVCPLGCRGASAFRFLTSERIGVSKAVRLRRCDKGPRRSSTYDFMSVPEPFST